jgi:hypothetical protein
MPNQIICGTPLSLVATRDAVSKLHQPRAVVHESQQRVIRFTFILGSTHFCEIWKQSALLRTSVHAASLRSAGMKS